MPPRLNLLASCRSLALRPKRPAPQWRPARAPAPRVLAIARGFADEATTPTPPAQPRPSSEFIPSPKVELDDDTVSLSALEASKPVGAEAQDEGPVMDNEEALRQLEKISYGLNPFDTDAVGHKYGLPELPIASDMSMKHRYHPVLIQLTNLLMKDGKKAKAQREMAMVLNFLRTFPAPKYSTNWPLMPGAPPASHLPLDPITYLTLAIDSVAPLIRLVHMANLGGGGRSLPVPMPLAVRQRRRHAFLWILERVEKKPSRGSGRTMLAHSIAEEIVAIIEGRSALWDKRMSLHKQGTTARVNVIELTRKRKA